MEHNKADAFYAALETQERILAHYTVRDLAEFMWRKPRPFLIAAAGRSVLQAVKATEIELVVAGMSCRGKTMQDAEQFTYDILDYAHMLYQRSSTPRMHSPRVTCGIGPFAGTDEIVTTTLHHKPTQISTHLELFGSFHLTTAGTKALRLQYDSCKPINVHFPYDSSPEAWLEFCAKEQLPHVILESFQSL